MRPIAAKANRRTRAHAVKEKLSWVATARAVSASKVDWSSLEHASADYAAREYGLTPREASAADKRISRSIAVERVAGTVTPLVGDWKQLRDVSKPLVKRRN